MKRKPFIRIASGQGFWGDLQRAPLDQIRLASSESPVHYLMLDYLAEVTMSIMQKQRQKDPSLGYARDFPIVIGELLPMLREKGIKVISNAGGVNPLACRDQIFSIAKKHGIKGLKIGVVYGDDIAASISDLIQNGETFNNMDNGEALEPYLSKVQSANVYFGAAPIAKCLEAGADIVVTGRCTDTGLTLAPMMYEFGWKSDDWNLLAAGTVAGHLLECGGQASGGNFLGDWESVPNLENIGFPIAEMYPNGEFFVTKHPGTGGLVSSAVLKEQLLYEIGNPTEYITPDVVADFTSIHLQDVAENRVRVYGISGKPATPFYKVSIAFSNGWYTFGSLTYAFPEPLKKAKRADEILRARLKNLGLEFEEIRTEYIGASACHHHLEDIQAVNEVQMRIGVYDRDKSKIERFGYEIAPLILTGPPSVTGFAGGRPKPSEVVAYWGALMKKDKIEPKTDVQEI
ncbi:MAG: acyclic terpene utilization AtuA family protein [Chloroherpetonaceae bacterium]|nr:acyclic terpene utilization AtuA family protein [Chloroherpetonaceae bacterium]